jgi:hypothetical protein
MPRADRPVQLELLLDLGLGIDFDEPEPQTCRKCGRVIALVKVATDAFPPYGPIMRWIAPSATPPITCSVTDRETGGRHLPAGEN